MGREEPVTRRSKLIGAVLVLVVAAALGAGIAWAAFVGTTSNSGNTFTASSCFNNTQRTSTGSYTGNAADGRAVTAGFKPDLVIVKANTNQIAIGRTSTMAGDASKPMSGATALAADRIESITSTGFTVGTNAQVNGNGTTYQWVAMKAGCGLKVGSYTGNGAASRAVTGVGFQPEAAFVMSANGSQAMERFAGMTRSYAFSTGTGSTTAITSLDAAGFTVGNAAETNTNGTAYHYVAFNDVAGSVLGGAYAGNNTDNRNINTVGFQPEYLMIRANDTGTSRSGHQRPGSLTGTASQFWANTANSTNAIQALQATGFQVGTDASVNANGPTYHFMAFKNTGGGCSVGGSVTATASADSWINQGSPTSNSGGDSNLKVTSKSGNANTRALVQFSLPSLPAGCSFQGATLRLYNKSPISGRTLEAYELSANWTENGVNWNNQPAPTGSAATAATPGAAGWMQWDVSTQVQSMYSGTNNGFLVRDQTENVGSTEQQFDSRESGTNQPQLVVQYG
jgi:hypothetical protein